MAKAEGKIAKRYARALFDLCPPSALESMRDTLKEFATTWSANPTLREAVVNPAVPLDQRVAAIREISKVVSSDASFSSFLVLLVSSRRVSALPEIADAFSKLVDQVKKLLSLNITSAFPLPQDEREQLEKKIQSEFGSLASIAWGVDGEILGGLTIKAGDKLLDGSVRGSLERIRASLEA